MKRDLISEPQRNYKFSNLDSLLLPILEIGKGNRSGERVI